MDQRKRKRFARQFGLPADRIKLFDELTQEQIEEVQRAYGLYNADLYVFAVKRDGGLVWNRYKIADEWRFR
jgi:hypothetical protein